MHGAYRGSSSYSVHITFQLLATGIEIIHNKTLFAESPECECEYVVVVSGRKSQGNRYLLPIAHRMKQYYYALLFPNDHNICHPMFHTVVLHMVAVLGRPESELE